MSEPVGGAGPSSWARRGLWTLVDQGVFSGSHFVAAVLLARWMDSSMYGAWAIAFALFTFLAQCHTALVLDPLGALGGSRFADRLPEYLGSLLRLHVTFTAPVGVLVGLAAAAWWRLDVGRACATVGLALPVLLAPWALRRAGYVRGEPRLSAVGSVVYAAALLVSLAVARRLGWLDASTAFVAMALAAALATWALHTPPAGRLDVRELVRAHWQFGRWLVAAGLLVALASQAPVLIAARVLGLAEAGVLRALQALTQPMLLTITALTALAVPPMATAFAREGRGAVDRLALRLSLGLALVAASFEALLLCAAGSIEARVYSGRFAASSGLLAWLGVAPLVLALTAGPQAAFQATHRPWGLLLAALAWAPAAVILGFVLTRSRGLSGAVEGSVAGYLVLGAAIGVIHRSGRRAEPAEVSA